MSPESLRLVRGVRPFKLRMASEELWIRPKFEANGYRVDHSFGDVKWMHSSAHSDFAPEYWIDEYDGPFRNQVDARRYTDEMGRRWILFYSAHDEHCVEMELLSSGTGEVRDVEPERAYEIAKEMDLLRPFKVVCE